MTDDKLQSLTNKKFVPVCAIGASAGGVTALQGLLRQLPTDLNLAYVVIIHLAPDQPSALTEILSVCTRMPVLRVDDGPTLTPNCVYVIPPDRELVIKGDSVTSRPFTEPRGQRAPIDMFFRSIAAARGDGIAVILSGAGADGTQGVRAVKEAGGVIMVQEPAEADFPSMPQNAIASGVADFVAPLARLAERLAEVAHSKEAVRSLDMDEGANDLRRIVAFLRARTGHDFSGYKRATVMRRVVRRMQVCRTDTLAQYSDYLLTAPEEAKELFSDLLISVTSFFRDPVAYAALERNAIKAIYDGLEPSGEEGVRAWVVGCATGEEAYSLAILFHEEAARRKLHPQMQIFATDLDEGALATAREGRYPRTIETDMSEERLARFFVDEGTHYRVRKEVRESVLFATHSAIKEPPFLRLDLVSCRNLLIYLERSLQQQLCSIFHYGLKPGCTLFLGSAETADVAADLFAPLDRDARIYCARPHASPSLPVFPQFALPERLTSPNLPARIRAERADLPPALHVAALERTAPASALVDDEQNVIHLSPSAGRFILHSAGPVTTLLPAMVRPELRLDLRLALVRALEAGESVLTHPVATVLDGERRRVSMHVMPVPGEEHTGGQVLVLFLDGGAAPDAEENEAAGEAQPGEIRRLHAELKAAQEALIASRGGHEATIQDLRATNEELQSTNEEYRSTAEELETSKEELQSINEELHTVNAELKSKLSGISVAHSDLQNLTTATDIGTLFLDADLRIKMFTPPIAELFNVTKIDIGRVVTDFTHRLEYDGIEEDSRRVLADLAPVEREVRSNSGRWYVVRLRPYRTLEDRIDGTVASFVDITDRRQAETALRESEARHRAELEEQVRARTAELQASSDLLQATMDSSLEMIQVFEAVRNDTGEIVDFRWILNNHAAESQYGDVIGKNLIANNPGMVDEGIFDTLKRVVETGEPDRSERHYVHEQFDSWFFQSAVKLGDGVATTTTDIGAWKAAQADILRLQQEVADAKLHESEARLRAVLEQAPLAIVFTGPTGDILFRNAMFDRLWGRPSHIASAHTYSEVYEGYHLHGRPVASEEWPGARAVLKGETVANETIQMVQANGNRITCWYAAGPIRDEAGRITGGVVLFRDISKERRILDELRDSEERLRQFGEASQDVLWVRDAETLQWQYLTPAFETIYGLSRAEALSGDNYRNWQDLIVPEDREYAVGSIQRVREGEYVTFEYRIRRPLDGTVRWLRNTDFPMRDVDGQVRLIGGVGHDVTELKRIEAALQDSESRLRTLVEGVPQLIWRSCAEGRWTWASPQWLDYTGQSQEESHGLGWLDVVHPDDQQMTLQAWHGARPDGRLTAECRVRRASDGAWRWHQTRSVPVWSASASDGTEGPIQEWLGTTTDIEDLKRLQAEQTVLVAELQHRTRNLLAVVRNVARRSIDPSAGRDLYDARLSSLGRVQGFLSRSTAYSVLLAEVVEAELLAAGDGTSDRVTVHGPAVELPGESVQAVALALHELATNAVKYGAIAQPSGRLLVTWRLEASDNGRQLVIDWHESGVTMQEGPPMRRGYGTELITQALPYQLGAKTALEFAADGVKCRVVLPNSTFTDPSKEEPT